MNWIKGQPHVTRDVTIGEHRYILRAWLESPMDWMRVAEWDAERQEEIVDRWARQQAEDEKKEAADGE